MFVKSGSLKKIMLLLCLISTVALVNVAPMDWGTEVVYAADASVAGVDLATTTDRISFYNVPSDHKLELQINYLDGRSAKIKYAAALCAPGTTINYDLNLYAVKFVADGCEGTVFQNLNLRWMGDCRFEFEHDPDARLIARGPYGETVIADGHYPAGSLQLTNLPANTTSLAATMSYTNEQGILQTGNVEFTFHQPQPGCGQTSTPTPTATQTTTTTVAITTPTPTATSTTTATATPTATGTATTSTATPTATSTATTVTATPTATDVSLGGESITDTPTPTVTPTATPSRAVLPPTGLDPVAEPKAPTLTLYLPIIVN